jgi:excisionase family DNA binding protein
MTSINDYLTVAEAAELLHVSDQRIYQFLRQSRIDGVIRKGWNYWIPRRSLVRFNKIKRLVGRPSTQTQTS